MGKFFPFTTWGSFPYNTVNEGGADIMNKQEVYAFLKEKNLDFEITEHPAVYSMEELAQVALPYPEADAKNLFVRDDKKRNYYLITVKGDKRVDLCGYTAVGKVLSGKKQSACAQGTLLCFGDHGFEDGRIARGSFLVREFCHRVGRICQISLPVREYCAYTGVSAVGERAYIFRRARAVK